MNRPLAAAVLTAVCTASSADAVGPPVPMHITKFAHYCNWHSYNPQHPQTSSWPHTNTQPVGGPYDSFDPAIVDLHNAQMAAEGIVPLVSWWGPDRKTGDRFLNFYLGRSSPVKIGLLYEATGRLIPGGSPGNEVYDFNNPTNYRTFVADLLHLQERYWSRPQYTDRWYLLEGKPVLFIWTTGAFKGPFWKAAQEAKTTVSVYIIGSDVNAGAFRPDLLDIVRGVDAMSAYGIYNPDMARTSDGQMNAWYQNQYRHGLYAWSDWLKAKAPGVEIIPALEFAYHDNNGNPTLTSTPQEASALAQAAYQFFLDRLSPCGNASPHLMGVSWNEHYEGTSWEPTVQFGDLWLRTLDQLFRLPLEPNDCRRQLRE